MGVNVRPACLSDGVRVLELLEELGYYPEPVSFANTFRKTLTDPRYLVRVAEYEGAIVGVASLCLRYQLGHGGLVGMLDEFSVRPGPHRKSAERHLRRSTVGRARALGAVQVIKDMVNTHLPPPRAAQRKAMAAAQASAA